MRVGWCERRNTTVCVREDRGVSGDVLYEMTSRKLTRLRTTTRSTQGTHSLWQLAWARSRRLCVKPCATVVARTVACAAVAVAALARPAALGAIIAVRFAAAFIGPATDGAYCSVASAAAAIDLVAHCAEMWVAAAKALAATPVAATVTVAHASIMCLAAFGGVETVMACVAQRELLDDRLARSRVAEF